MSRPKQPKASHVPRPKLGAAKAPALNFARALAIMQCSLDQLKREQGELMRQVEGRSEAPAATPLLADLLPAEDWRDECPPSPRTPPLGPLLAQLGDPLLEWCYDTELTPPEKDISKQAHRDALLDRFECRLVEADMLVWSTEPKELLAVYMIARLQVHGYDLLSTLQIDEITGEVAAVRRSSVAHTLGVKRGWRLARVNGRRFTPSRLRPELWREDGGAALIFTPPAPDLLIGESGYVYSVRHGSGADAQGIQKWWKLKSIDGGSCRWRRFHVYNAFATRLLFSSPRRADFVTHGVSVLPDGLRLAERASNAAKPVAVTSIAAAESTPDQAGYFRLAKRASNVAKPVAEASIGAAESTTDQAGTNESAAAYKNRSAPFGEPRAKQIRRDLRLPRRFNFDAARIQKMRADLDKYDVVRASLGHVFYRKVLTDEAIDAQIREMDSQIATLKLINKMEASVRQSSMVAAASPGVEADPAGVGASRHCHVRHMPSKAGAKHNDKAGCKKRLGGGQLKIEVMEDYIITLRRLKKVNDAIRQAMRAAAILAKARAEEMKAATEAVSQSPSKLACKRARAQTSVLPATRRNKGADAAGEELFTSAHGSDDEYIGVEWTCFESYQGRTAGVDGVLEAPVDDLELECVCVTSKVDGVTTGERTR